MSTNEILFFRCKWEEICAYVEEYIIESKITVESFWEDHVLQSNHYKMMICDIIVGYFSIHNNDTITMFNVFLPYANQSQELFARVKKYENITNAMVPTSDEFFISHCFDNFIKIEKQAYFSIYTEKTIPTERKKQLNLRLADVDKDCEILKLSGDFLDDIIKQVRNGANHINVYIAEYNDNVVGFGVVDYGTVI